VVKKLRLGCVLVVGWRSCQRVFQKGMYYLWRAMHERDGEFREVMVSDRPQAQYSTMIYGGIPTSTKWRKFHFKKRKKGESSKAAARAARSW
jgi:hypothetical protein